MESKSRNSTNRWANNIDSSQKSELMATWKDAELPQNKRNVSWNYTEVPFLKYQSGKKDPSLIKDFMGKLEEKQALPLTCSA